MRTLLKEAGASYTVLVSVVALNAPLILAFILADLVGNGLSWSTWFYASTVAIGYYCLPPLLVVSVIVLVTLPVRRATITLGSITVGLFVAYLALDSLAYPVTKFHIDPFWIDFLVRDYSGIGLSSSAWLVVLGVVLGVGLVQLGIVAIARRIRLRRAVGLFPVVVVFAFTSSQIVHIVAHEWNDQRVTSLTPHFPLYKPITSHGNASAYRELLPWVNAQAASHTRPEEYSSIRYPLSQPRYDPAQSEHPPNIILILLESWRYDCMNGRVSPNIYALGQRSSAFHNHLSTGNQTTCGVFGLFYGLHATYWQAVKANSSEIDNPVLIDALEAENYSLGIFARSGFERHKIKDTIFHEIEVHESFAGRSKVEQDADLTRQLLGFVEDNVEQPRPFFAFAFYKSTHAPYEYPAGDAVFPAGSGVRMGLTSTKTDPSPLLGRYRNAVHYVDTLVGEVIDRLEELGQMDNTLIIVTSDHGESFNDNQSNYFGHGTNYTEYQTHVPLVFYAPGREPREYSHRTSHIDIAPTLLSQYLGCTSDIADYSNGRILFDDTPGPRPLAIGSYVNHAFVFGSDVYEIWPLHTRKYRLSDVTAAAGVPESTDLRLLTDDLRRFSSR